MNTGMTAVVARIILRYVAAYLVAKGVLSTENGSMLAGDPDVLSALTAGFGVACALAAEGWYWLAKRFGWDT